MTKWGIVSSILEMLKRGNQVEEGIDLGVVVTKAAVVECTS